MQIINGTRQETLSDDEVSALLDSLVASKKERIKIMESANALANRRYPSEHFGIGTIDRLIKVFSP